MKKPLFLIFFLLWIPTANAHDSWRTRSDKHAPAGLMGDHLHKPGTWMLEYKYMNMYMEGNRAGATRINDADSILFGANSSPVTNRGATPTAMTHEMHMVHVMGGVTENITAYAMIMAPAITMDHLRGPMNPAGSGTDFRTHNSGFGDLTLGALLGLYSDETNDIILNLAGSVPTGEIYRTTSIPTDGAMSQAMPYPMRLGSGTFNAKPGITWKHFTETGSYGVQFQTDLPIGRNYRGYSVSDEFRLNTWYSHVVSDNVSASLRVENLWRNQFGGADPDANNMLISTNVESFRGGYWLNFGAGVATILNGHLLNVEFVPTLHQNLNGIQLETDWSLVASWSKSF
jgi:hypothetical protein